MAEPKYFPNGKRIEELIRRKGYATAADFNQAITKLNGGEEIISTRTIQLIIEGKQKSKESTLQIIADKLAVDIEEIILQPHNSSLPTTEKHDIEFDLDRSLPDSELQKLIGVLKDVLQISSVREIRIRRFPC